MPKDIRSFFGVNRAAAAPAGTAANGKKAIKRPADAPIDLTEEVPIKSPAKKQKTGDAASSGKAKKATPQKQPAANKPKAFTKGSTPKKPAKAEGKAKSGKGKKAQLVESESDASDESESDYLGQEEEVEADDVEIDIDSGDSEEELMSQKKKIRKAVEPAQTKKTNAKAASTSQKPQDGVPPSPDQPAAKVPPGSKRATPKSFAAKAPQTETMPSSRAKRTPKEEIPADVKAAIAAVDATAKKLPHMEFDVTSTDGFGTGGGQDVEPPHIGSKELPRGHSECLQGKTFVITGVLDSLWRNEAEDLIKRHSGRVTGNVSGKTSFLLAGDQPGKSKVAMAQAKGTKIINEDGLMALVKAAPAPKESLPLDADDSEDDVSFVSASAVPAGRASKLGAELNKLPASSKRPQPLGSNAGVQISTPNNGQLWVEKYRPKNMNELVGNNTVIANLRQWLQNWEGVHLRGEEAAQQKGRGKPKDLGKKAVLMNGPPGIGKTSSAMIITRELGYQPVEINASDTRNKADSKITGGMGGKLANAVKEMCTNTALGRDAQGRKKRICLVMDEVDGMSGGDRGGVGELIGIIKTSKVPIICICNDKYNQKLKSLRNSTLELDFRKPTSDQIAKRAMTICKAEGLTVNETTLNTVAAGANGDIRLVLGQLQMIRLRSRTLSYDDAKAKMGSSKDADMSPFEAGRRLLSSETSRMSLMDRTELVFQDMDLVPLLVQENYLNHRPSLSTSEQSRLSLIAKAADAFSMGDIVNRAVRQHQNWSLMPFGATVGSVLPATYMRGPRETFYGEMNFPRFTAWLGQNSSFGKQKRLMGELHTRMSASGNTTADRTGMRTDYLPSLRKSLVKPLIDNEKDGVMTVIYEMQDYCLNKDDHQFILDVTQFKSRSPALEDPYKHVPTAVKSAFTRQLNQNIAHTRPKSNIMVEEFKRGGRLRKKEPIEDNEEGLGGDPELEAMARQDQGTQEEASDEDDWTPKDAKELAKKEKQMAKRGITFQSKVGPAAKGKKSSGKASAGRGSAGRGSGTNSRGRGRARGK